MNFSPPFRGIDWEDALENRHDAKIAIVRGHARVERWIIQEASKQILDGRTITGLHRIVFEGVFPEFSGRLRGDAPRFIPVNVTFANFRGVPYSDVPDEFAKFSLRVVDIISQLDELHSSLEYPEFLDQVLRGAAYVHAELIRIHPFRNGNGRIARVCINYFASRYGLFPIPFERPASEYLKANQAWLDRRDIQPLVDFLRPLCVPRQTG